MVWVCGKEITNNEYPWGIDPCVLHEHGEPQMDMSNVDDPCCCAPVEISDSEFNRRRQVVFDKLQVDG